MNRKIKKEVRRLIKEEQINGKSSKEIYNHLVKEYRGEENAVAKLVVTALNPKYKKKHSLYIGILLGFTAIVALFNVWVNMNDPFEYFSDIWQYISTTSVVFAYAGLIALFYVKEVPIYTSLKLACPFLIIALFFPFVLATWLTIGGIYWLYVAIDLLSILFIVFLAHFFQRKIFPDYRYGNFRYGAGEYIFQ